MLGISIYPYKEKLEDTLNYLKLANKYGYKRIFMNFIILDDRDIDEIIEKYEIILKEAKKLDFQVVMDINQHSIDCLKKDNYLEYFSSIGLYGIRLDETFGGNKEAEMTYNDYDLKIEFNLSQGSKYIDHIMSLKPNKNAIMLCHNFYPQRYTGLSVEFFERVTKKYKNLGLRTAAFVASSVADHGPHPFNDSLVTIEEHREMNILSQAKYFIATGLIDDIIISNAFASEEELKNLSEIYKPYVIFDIELEKDLTDDEEDILNYFHQNRQDANDIIIRSSFGRIDKKNANIPESNSKIEFKKGDISISNNDFLQYKGELNVYKKDLKLKEVEGLRNKIGKIVDEEIFLLDYITEYSRFKFRKR